MCDAQLRDVSEPIYRASKPNDDHADQRFVLWVPCHSSQNDNEMQRLT
jgi:hypothetical protein